MSSSKLRFSLFCLYFILVCIFLGTIYCIKNNDAAQSPLIPSGNDLVDWNELPSCARGSCYVVYQLTVCPEGGLTRLCFCHNMMSISDHCLPSCSEDEIEQVGLWEAEQCLYSDSGPTNTNSNSSSNTDTGVYTNSNTNTAQGRISSIAM